MPFAREAAPERLWDELKVDVDVAERDVDIVEVRPPWEGVGEHPRFPIARGALHADDRPLADLLARPRPQAPRV